MLVLQTAEAFFTQQLSLKLLFSCFLRIVVVDPNDAIIPRDLGNCHSQQLFRHTVDTSSIIV